jgi:ubiquinone/menaquinone biosynthesis C-methylase UbiE
VIDRDDLRRNLLRFTDRAFGLLPGMMGPRILDLGCGTGVPTLRLAELTDGHIVGLDSSREALEVLRARVEELGLEERVQVREGTFQKVPFGDQSFDLLWCEGALWVMGFRESLRAWRRLLRHGGFLVAHDEAGELSEKRQIAEEEGFVLLEHFEISEDIWWEEYFSLAEDDPGLAEEVSRFREHPEEFRSAFFILRLDGKERG